MANHAKPNGTPTPAPMAARFGDRFVREWLAKFSVQFPSVIMFWGGDVGVEEVDVYVEREEKREEVDIDVEGEEEVEHTDDICQSRRAVSPRRMVLLESVQL